MSDVTAVICASSPKVRLGIARMLREHGGYTVGATTTAFASLTTLVRASEAQVVVSEEFRHGVSWAINVELVGPEGFRLDHGVGWRLDVAVLEDDDPAAAEVRFTVLERAVQSVSPPRQKTAPLRGAPGAIERFASLVARARQMSPTMAARSTPVPL